MKQFIISKTVTQRIGFNMSLVALTVAGAFYSQGTQKPFAVLVKIMF